MEVSFRKIFEAPTIEQLAAVLDASVSGKEPSARISPIPHITGTESGPVSILQERLWLLEELDPAQSLTHMHPAAWDLRGALDTEIAKKALHDFVERHEIMRTSFHLSEGVRTQTVAGESVIPVSLVDLSELSEAERQRALTDHFQSQLSEAFDLGRAPLVRISLIRCGPDDTVLHTVHHGMVWDGWSFDIFIREFAENYSARVSGQSPALSQLPITYADFARWQREWMLGAEAAEQAKWWREQLEGVPDGLELPTDRPRVAHSLHRGGRVTLKFSAEEVELLKAMARKHDATMFMLVFAAYNVLLHRYTGQKDLVVGTPVRSRTRSETEDVVGPFVNTVAMRSRIDPAMQFADFLRNVREVTLESLERQELPFELLGTTPPALRVLFSMQDARERPSRIGELSIEQLHVPEHSASNDLMLWTMEYQSHLLAALNYSSELFDHGTAERFLRQLRTLLLAALEDPTQSIATINILPDEELAAVLGTDRETPDNEFVHSYEQIADWASRAPSAIALISNGESLSYGALMERTAKAAESLRAVSLANGPELAIAIGSDTVVGMLAAMRSGGAIMLIDPDDPAIYRAKLLTEPRVSALIVDEEKRDELSVDGIPTVVVASTAGLFETRPADAATDDVALSFADLAAITHHPGPTGEPLKSSLSERALTTLLDDLRMLLSVSSEDVTVSCVRSGTDTALIEILLPLTSGATLIIAPDDVLSSGDRLAALLGQVGATLMIAPLSIWRSLAAADWNGGPTFRAVITGPPHVSSELSSLSGRAGKVFTAYGYPEIGIWSAVHEVSAVEFHPILGTPVGGARFFVLDDLRAPTPIGVPGDLYVEAPFFSKDASGSMDPPARIVDAQRISPVKLFRTGDRARRMADGTVRYVSGDPTRARVDGPVVEFSAVERALLSHPSIVSAAVTCMRDLTGVPRLVAYVMRTPGADYTDTELRAKVRKVLPGTMIPNVIVELDALPTDGAGKLDRLSLPSPFADESQSRAFVPPRTEQERVLAEAWVAALGIERVDVRDNFFMRGGSSLLCFRVIETLQREHGIRLSPRALLLGTLEQAAAQIELGQRSAQSGASAGPMLTAPGALQKLKALIQGVK
jgi:non-ribosomal peptide synthetase component F